MVCGTACSDRQPGLMGLKVLFIVISEDIQMQDPWMMHIGPALTLAKMPVYILVSWIELQLVVLDAA